MPLLSRPNIAVGDFLVDHDELCAYLSDMYSDIDDADRKLRAVKNTAVGAHYYCRPLTEVIPPSGQGAPLSEKARTYQHDAYLLAEQAARGVLDSSGVEPGSIDAIITSTNAVYNTPSLDVELIDRLDINGSVDRIPMVNLGCVGATATISRATDLVRYRTSSVALVVVLDLPSYLLNPQDTGIDSMILRGLSSDGAAAFLVYGDEVIPASTYAGPCVSETWFMTDASAKDLVGWWTDDTGNHMKNSKELINVVEGLLGKVELSYKPDFIVPHPGSMKIIDAVCDALDCDRSMGWAGRDCLRRTGHMVGSAVLDVLRRTFDEPPPAGSKGALLAVGPGVTMGISLLTWH